MNDMTSGFTQITSPTSGLGIGPGTEVTLHFALKLDNGEVVDSTSDRGPATFTVGDGNLLAGFEKALYGLVRGYKGVFVIKPEQGFGRRNPNNVQEIPRSQFGEDLELSEGLVLSFADARKAELPGVVTAFDDQIVTVDFNHPLAGQDVLFEVEIIQVKPAVTH